MNDVTLNGIRFRMVEAPHLAEIGDLVPPEEFAFLLREQKPGQEMIAEFRPVGHGKMIFRTLYDANAEPKKLLGWARIEDR